MTDVQGFFMSHARVSRKTLARFAEVDPVDVDAVADDLGFGPLLRLDEAEEVLSSIEEGEADEEAEDATEEDGADDQVDDE